LQVEIVQPAPRQWIYFDPLGDPGFAGEAAKVRQTRECIGSISNMFDLKPQILSNVQKASTFGIGIGIDIAIGSRYRP
jgi:hypothetical protein